jgi:uncharacterized protein (TIGR02145 family)
MVHLGNPGYIGKKTYNEGLIHFIKKETFMQTIKAIVAGLMAAAVGMAAMSGKVTDTSGTAILGAVVQLELGGQTATTGTDGSFSLFAGNAIIPGKSNPSLAQKLSATMQNGLLWVTVAEKSAVEITTFDITGKALSRVRHAMNPGIHSIALPQRSAGIYLYKAKAGNSEFVLRSNSIAGITQGTAVSIHGFSSYSAVAKQANVAAAIKDVIAVTKAGYLKYRAAVTNSDTSGMEIKMLMSAGTVTDTDGNVYQTVKIGNQVWTVENLRTTKYNDGSAIPPVTDGGSWAALATSGYCYYGNTANADSIKKFGALYNWYAANSKKLAPPGWHIPTDAEWDTLRNYLITNGYNWDGSLTDNKIAKAMAAKADWSTSTSSGAIGNDLTFNNRSGFSALPAGFRDNSGSFINIGNVGHWWSVVGVVASGVFDRYLNYDYENIDRLNIDYFKTCGFSVRLVR